MMKILVLNGPNMNLLGQRPTEHYGSLTLSELQKELVTAFGDQINAGQLELFFFQTNHEGQLIDVIQNAERSYAGIVYNPAAHTHYSIALRDAVEASAIPVVEVHLSDISEREEFRRHSVIADVCIGQFMGQGPESYKQALQYLMEQISG